MKLSTLRRGGLAAVTVLALSGAMTACGSDSNSASDGSSDGSSAASGAGAQTFGDGCSLVDPTGPGSFDGMVNDPVATAASHNPLLKTLVAAVGAVNGLADTLNTQDAITVFAPDEDAFAALPAGTVDTLVAGAKKDGTKSDLYKILAHHVIPMRLDPTQIVGDQTTLEGDTVTVAGDTSGMTVKDKMVTAKVVCGNVPTANATVYIIDSVLTGL